MCGIVGAVAERDVAPILLEGLRRLEYRGYDSAGVALIDGSDCIQRTRTLGKVKVLEEALAKQSARGSLGIAHTRWATHGKPAEHNAHPHVCYGKVALVHNGIIENHEELRQRQMKDGFAFTSETDTETVVHEVYRHREQDKDLLEAVQSTVELLEGAFALGVIDLREPDRLVVARRGSPLVIGVGIGEHFIASDVAALLPVTNNFIFLEDGDIADIRRDSLVIYDARGERVERAIKQSQLTADAAEKGPYRHYMLKEIYEQPRAIADTLEGRIANNRLIEEAFGMGATELFDAEVGS